MTVSRELLPSEGDRYREAVERLKAQPTREVFYVDVGNLSPEEAREHIEKWRKHFKGLTGDKPPGTL